MQEILFRGKRMVNDEWIEGFYAKSGDSHFILIDNSFAVGYVRMKEVVPESVGQFTGLTDKNGKKIFEGDIVADAYGWKGLVEFFTEDIGSCGCCVPKFDGSGFKAKHKNHDSGVDMRSCTIVGNIYDNPEMWEEEE